MPSRRRYWLLVALTWLGAVGCSLRGAAPVPVVAVLGGIGAWLAPAAIVAGAARWSLHPLPRYAVSLGLVFLAWLTVGLAENFAGIGGGTIPARIANCGCCLLVGPFVLLGRRLVRAVVEPARSRRYEGRLHRARERVLA